MASFTTSLPLYVTIGVRKKKNIYFNYNRVMQLHFQQRNQIKKLFMNIVKKNLESCPKFTGKVYITYTVYKPSKRRYDVMNVVSIVDKFFQDTLVEEGKLQDDNYTIVPVITGIHGGISKSNPRVEVTIEEISEEVYQKDLKEAHENYKDCFSEEII